MSQVEQHNIMTEQYKEKLTLSLSLSLPRVPCIHLFDKTGQKK